ncbi:MAG: hypothetical protein WCQ96_02260 [Patescibacteria group bacterium]
MADKKAKINFEISKPDTDKNDDLKLKLLGSKLASLADISALGEKLASIGRIAEFYDASDYIGFRKFLNDSRDKKIGIFNTTDDIEPDNFIGFETIMERQNLEAVIRDAIKDVITEIQDKKINYNKKPWQKILTLTDESDLCLGSNKYEFRTEGKRIRIIYNLLEAKDYIKTKTLREKTGYKTDESLRDAIKEINGKAKYRLKIKDNLIEGRAESGYRINQNYFII